MKKIFKLILVMITGITISVQLNAQNLQAKVKIDKSIAYQKITGFGGFVCSPQFGYNHMTTTEIQKLWGAGSVAGYNIMRLYIPEQSSNWSAALATAQLAKSMGLTIFASPWTMPADWKTNNHVNAVYTDPNGVQQVGYLKPEKYQDYALYLNSFVTYLQNNGVALDYISIQNEPDEMAQYQGCIWTPAQIASFVKNYGQLINCKVIAPESVGFTDNYANAFLDPLVMANFEVYGGHQYGSMQSVYKQFQNHNKEIWQTEYLINWNSPSSQTPRDFLWDTDGFTFAKSVNNALLGNVNAWIHYASKRYYGLMGDGSYGTVAGEMTKRGYILSQYAKNTTGKTRIDAKWETSVGALEGSSYISLDGNQITLVVINSSSNTYDLKVDLPFFTTSGVKTTTSQSLNMASSPFSFSTASFRPTVQVSPSSVMTFVFNKSGDRPVSLMTGGDVHYNKIETQIPTNSAFGTNYQLSGKTVTFYNSTPLISSNTDANSGYLNLDDRYNKLIFHVLNYTTSNLPTSSNTTLYYVDANGTVRNHNYGSVAFPAPGSGSFNLVFDISRAVLPYGCKGIIGLRSGNYSSILTLTLGDVYFNIGNERASKFAAAYSLTDSNLMDALENEYYTSVDFRDVTGNTSADTWINASANRNSIFYVNGSVSNTNVNVVSGNSCQNLSLSDLGKDFQVPFNFTASSATYTRTFNGYGIVLLPFQSAIPSGTTAYTMQPNSGSVICTQISNGVIPANTSVLINATGSKTFTGSGAVSTPKAITVNQINGVYQSIKVAAGGYVLKTENGVTGFYKVTAGNEPTVNSFQGYLTENNTYTDNFLPLSFATLKVDNIMAAKRDIILYPNPAKTEIFVDWKATDAVYSIIDAKGSTVSYNAKLTKGKNRIDISKLPTGVYFIEIFGSGENIKTKFIKQ
ncbi:MULTISPECIES: T9SS type A sorting domain-containing protein [Chryseobacterium]|uniref:Glucuronoarabinoxylan endo-1,4-beta-xylanase n=1 Tax=Chryseobacterium geocarposphaerae TaxID=1416776 RepID=A0ABU1LA98_9FLAO|nr:MULTISPECIES: T9SS type A sorting domain-containing protein [Chryseobacterium]MDR6403646.1 glucuronoarabinoxylan endo-1,4-beta-xylanase [Chryseobacterium geocarposphaerae]MDR6697200.1 glucuronoarabinoxylan endo-1,4-beta-xylanase [Chryseobacterium ginsenosidimutans]